MENLNIVISLFGTTVGFAVTLLTVIVRLSKNKKIKQKAEELLVVGDLLLGYIEEAEKFTNYEGIEKKEYVLTKVSKYTNKNKIKLSDEDIERKLEELVDLTKKVNIKRRSHDWLEANK